MANLNGKQNKYITDLANFTKDIIDLYGKAHDLKKRHSEQFDSGKTHDFSNCDNLMETHFISCSDIDNAVNALDEFINFWIGNAVSTNEYGKYFREIKNVYE